jgi:hypothetical protein
MFQRPPDSHWAIRSHIAARAVLMPAPDVLPPPLPPVLVVAAGRALVPTLTTAATGLAVTVLLTTLVLVFLPST